jgi:two-component system chemotaxis response regulator CheY
MKNIMFIDDSLTVHTSTRNAVAGLDVAISQYTSAIDAMDDCQNGAKPDLIITDQNMPDMTGMEFIEHIRGVAGFEKTPILMLTTESGDELKAKAKQLGLTGWILKPFNPKKFQAAIKRVLRV